MKTTRYLTEDELIEQALKALVKAIGPIETARFMTLRRTRRLDSVKRHRRWQKLLRQTEFFNQVFGPNS